MINGVRCLNTYIYTYTCVYISSRCVCVSVLVCICVSIYMYILCICIFHVNEQTYICVYISCTYVRYIYAHTRPSNVCGGSLSRVHAYSLCSRVRLHTTHSDRQPAIRNYHLRMRRHGCKHSHLCLALALCLRLLWPAVKRLLQLMSWILVFRAHSPVVMWDIGCVLRVKP